MIGVAGKDLLGAVELFQEHAARQQMRPGHGTQGQHELGFVPHLIGEAVGAADEKRQIGGPGVAPLGELRRPPWARLEITDCDLKISISSGAN